MKRKKLIYGLAVILAIALWVAFRPERLFVNGKVSEAMPAGLSNLSQTVKKAGFLELGTLKGNIGDQNYDIPADADLAKYRAVTIWCKRFSVNFGTAPLNSSAAAPGMDQVLASGNFHDVAHKGVGQATIYQLGSGQRVLRFTNFETSNGPNVRVYLIATKDARDSETVKRSGFVEVGALKGNIGDQNYEISSDLDLNKYRAVTIWCKRFGVNFATAPLTAAGTAVSANR